MTIEAYTISTGFFAGCTIYMDDSLPPDCASYERDGKRIVWNTVTGEIIEMKEHKMKQQNLKGQNNQCAGCQEVDSLRTELEIYKARCNILRTNLKEITRVGKFETE